MGLNSVEVHSHHLSHLFLVLVMKVTCSVAYLTHLLQCAVAKPGQELLVKVCTAVQEVYVSDVCSTVLMQLLRL